MAISLMRLVHLAALLLGTAQAQTGCPSYAGCVDPAPACPVAGQKFEPPLRSVTCCLDADTFEPESACGPAVARRTQFNNDWCARSAAVQAGNLSAAKALRGTVLDIILVPAEDETLYAQPLDGEPAYYYGMVGDALAVWDVCSRQNRLKGSLRSRRTRGCLPLRWPRRRRRQRRLLPQKRPPRSPWPSKIPPPPPRLTLASTQAQPLCPTPSSTALSPRRR